MAATIVSWRLSAVNTLGHDDNQIVGAIVLAVGFIKARYVGLDFMELRSAPVALRLVFEAWICAVFVLIAVLYLVA